MFNRVLNVAVNGVLIGGLRIDFDFLQSTRKNTDEPDNGEIKIYNLSPYTRKLISKIGSAVTLNAGHIDNLAAPIVYGTLTNYREERTDTDIASILEIEDKGGVFGQNAIETTKRSLSFPPGVTANSVIATIASLSALPIASVPFIDYVFLDGYSFSGLLKSALDDIVYNVLRLEWHITNGALYVLGDDIPALAPPQAITALTGLIGGVETYYEEERGKLTPVKKYKFRTLVTSRVFVGMTVPVVSVAEKITAVTKIESIRKYGSNWTNEFYNDYTGRAIA